MQVLRFIFAAGVMALLGSALLATSAIKLDLETLIEKSTVVIVGKVDAKEARWDAGKKGIWTHHEITVSETLKGEHEKSRDVVTRGGVVGRVGQNVSGAGHFEVGDEYVFFLWEDDDSRLRLTGMVQGAFAVTEKKGVKHAANSTAGLKIIDPETLKPAKDKVSRQPLEYKLTDLKTTVETQVNKEAKKKANDDKPKAPAPEDE